MPPVPAERRVFCSRSLNLRSIRAVGYDLDYTLVHYGVEDWERTAYEHLRRKLDDRGWPVADLRFDPRAVIRGLVIDTELGNLLKANRFGYVKQAAHGTTPLPQAEKKRLYGREVVDPAQPRYVFLNTLFSLSEASMYAQLVDRLDEGRLPAAVGYHDLYASTRAALDEAHMEGQLKAEILADPERFIALDPELALTLLDQRAAGLQLVLITNSEWAYTKAVLDYVFARILPDGPAWRELFRLVIVAARKPAFFQDAATPVFEVVDDEGLLRPVPGGIARDGVYLGGDAAQVERHLGLDGSQLLYVGDHMYGDVQASKGIRRWRTALVLRELEDEMAALSAFAPRQRELTALMAHKRALEDEICQARVACQRLRQGYGPPLNGRDEAALDAEIQSLRDRMRALDRRIAPLAIAANRRGNSLWGPLMRAGSDKSFLAKEVEQHADVYTSRVSNFLYETPFAYFRSPYGSLPHDPGPA